MDEQAAAARLEALMLLAARDAGAAHAALFMPAGEALTLVAHVAVDQAALDFAYSGWACHRKELLAGKVVRYGRVALWPIHHQGHFVALVYLDQVPAAFPDDNSRESGMRIAACLTYIRPAKPWVSYLNCGLTHVQAAAEMERDQLAILLRFYQGNVAAVARHLGVQRETIYARAARADLDIDEFRPRPRRHRLQQPA